MQGKQQVCMHAITYPEEAECAAKNLNHQDFDKKRRILGI
jgi:hypothetical protein